MRFVVRLGLRVKANTVASERRMSWCELASESELPKISSIAASLKLEWGDCWAEPTGQSDQGLGTSFKPCYRRDSRSRLPRCICSNLWLKVAPSSTHLPAFVAFVTSPSRMA